MNKIFLGLGLLLFSITTFPQITKASVAANVTSPYYYNFNSDGILYETGSMSDTSSPYWWVNSGGDMNISLGLGSTMQGSLPAGSLWRNIYSVANPLDTDNGLHPQNIFRLVTRSKWQNISEQAYFKIISSNISSSPNRDVSNGLLLFNRYYDQYNTYYAGIRVDGAAVIKKKINGVYYTLSSKKIFSGTYNRATNPNLLPKNTWVGLRTETVNGTDGSTTIKLYTDVGRTGNWTLVLQAKDDGKSFGGSSLSNAAYAGIRTDFMDVQFDDFKIVNL